MQLPLPTKARIFLTSFLILVTELSLIRWIPAQIRLAGYFSNLILLSTFLGLGLGLLLARRRISLEPFFPAILALTIGLTWLIKIEVNVATPEVIFFNTIAPPDRPLVEPTVVLPIIFVLIGLVFIPPGQLLGKLFRQIKPLTAYSADILGAIAGIIIFTLLSALSLPPFWWFLAVAIAFLIISVGRWKLSWLQKTGLGLIIILPLQTNGKSVWSPYYKISVSSTPNISIVDVNGTSHQYVNHYQNREDFYFVPYRLIKNPEYRRILIIGAGTGADTAVALGETKNLERIDAVEIDPWLLRLGRTLNPDRPYENPRVKTHVADGRNFLEQSKDTYDLIIFGLPDSLVLQRGTGHIRLESFLFTREAFSLARDHLSENGLFVLYNFYRQPWLVERLASTLAEVFGSQPLVGTIPTKYLGAALLSGPKTKEANLRLIQPFATTSPLPIPTDDWPFLYLKTAAVPRFYLNLIGLFGIIGLVSAVVILRKNNLRRVNYDEIGRFFFLGAGFMLIETKSLVTFALLFGNTWLVNSLVFAGILVSILMANVISDKIKIGMSRLYAGLLAVLILNAIISQSWFFGLPLTFRYIFASGFYFSPILIANLIFAQRFKMTQAADAAFGTNLLGALAGGFLEYSALAVGYRALSIMAICLYGLSFINISKLWQKAVYR